MSKGIGTRQREILKIIAERTLPGEKMEIHSLYRVLKNHFFPDMTQDDFNRARVSISNSISGLIKRGYLEKEKKFSGMKKFSGSEKRMNNVLMEMGLGKLEEKKTFDIFIKFTEDGQEYIRANVF